MNDYDVIVAGIGAMGSAALDHLARRGARVLGIDPFESPHGHGSSGGDSRLIRKAYFEHPDYVPLLERAYQGWQELETDTGAALLFRTGIAYVGEPQAPLLAGSRRSAAAHDLVLEELDATALGECCPSLRCPEGYQALFEPDAGYLLCEHAVAAQLGRARSRGAVLATGERVTGWRADHDGVAVTTDRSRYRSGALVITAGSWSARLLAGLDCSLQVTRQLLFWVPPGRGQGQGACWAVQRPDAPGLFYGFPALPDGIGDRAGVKVAHHAPGEPADPDAERRAPEASEFEALRRALAPFLPDLTGPPRATHVCLYTSTPDGHFVIDRHPASGRVVFGCGFSGHGFKFAPVIGEALADLALEGRTALPVGFLKCR